MMTAQLHTEATNSRIRTPLTTTSAFRKRLTTEMVGAGSITPASGFVSLLSPRTVGLNRRRRRAADQLRCTPTAQFDGPLTARRCAGPILAAARSSGAGTTLNLMGYKEAYRLLISASSLPSLCIP